jgi:hypothetical protein
LAATLTPRVTEEEAPRARAPCLVRNMAPVSARRCQLRNARAFHVGNRLTRRNVANAAATLEAPNATASSAALGVEGSQDLDVSSMYSEFASLISGTVVTVKNGDTVRGTVIDVDRKAAHVDIGGKGAAIAPLEEISIIPLTDVRASLKVALDSP